MMHLLTIWPVVTALLFAAPLLSAGELIPPLQSSMRRTIDVP